MYRMKELAGPLGMALPVLALTCGLAWAQSTPEIPAALKPIVEKAKSEGQVVVYSSQSDAINQDLKKGFEATFGITMNYLRLTSGPQAEKIQQELDAKSVNLDVFSTGDPSFAAQLVKNGQVQSIKDVPVADGFPTEQPYITDNCRQAQQFAHSIGYNTNVVPEANAPKTWDDVLDPRWKGEIGVVSPRVGTGIQTWWFVMLDKEGQAFFDKLAAQNVRMYEDVGSIQNDLASGAIGIWIPGWPYGIQALVNAGAPVASAYPAATSGVSDTECLMTAAPHPNAGKLFLWYVTTLQGQTAINGDHRGNSPRSDVASSDQLPAGTIFPKPADITAARDKLFAIADKVATAQ